jgi:hypothetical protein
LHLAAGWRRLLSLGVCDPEDIWEVELSAAGPCGEWTHPANSRTSSLTMASRLENSPGRAPQCDRLGRRHKRQCLMRHPRAFGIADTKRRVSAPAGDLPRLAAGP